MQIPFPQSVTSHVHEKVVNIAYMGGASAVQLPVKALCSFGHDFPLCCSLGKPTPQAIYGKACGNRKV